MKKQKKAIAKASEAMEQILANTIPFCRTSYIGQGSIYFDPLNPGKPTRSKPSIPQKLVHCSRKIYDLLHESELKVFTTICNDLRHNNALWVYDPVSAKKEDTTAIESLVKKKILFPTENSSFFIVNPLAIRRGRISSVIAATSEIIGKNIGLNTKMIKKLRPSSGYMKRLYDSDPSVPSDPEVSDPFMQ